MRFSLSYNVSSSVGLTSLRQNLIPFVCCQLAFSKFIVFIGFGAKQGEI